MPWVWYVQSNSTSKPMLLFGVILQYTGSENCFHCNPTRSQPAFYCTCLLPCVQGVFIANQLTATGTKEPFGFKVGALYA